LKQDAEEQGFELVEGSTEELINSPADFASEVARPNKDGKSRRISRGEIVSPRSSYSSRKDSRTSSISFSHNP